ncbi:hypothetical protein [Haloferax volcanii]|uniref:DUF7981 domain-containing protein n=3 Tax=Haloferax volcanii TaxID=2246 RepID=L9UM12_HALVD|nr:hypothetical protein [Haloferax volcanii]AOP12811.1 uncharacterized protein HVO_0458A [Haloferax volcanii DS2]ELY25945.1 hypothetical protein C498_16389 [Haloferax volcanii DS2]MBS8118959.1 hypothetical protein [Haloferax volcanii]MBS8123973.1 hypothetical protein [Haloferax volcanii]MBS8127842.1 hypothetical protein [Haloferax volcanii]
MARRVRSALAWGAASLLLVGVLAQGAVLLGLGIDASFGVVAAVAVASGVAVASVTYVIEPRLERKGRA